MFSVAIKENVVVEYVKQLHCKSVSSLAQTASQNVDSKRVGRKVAVKSHKRNIPISPEKLYGTSQDYKFYRQATCYQAQAPYGIPQDYHTYQQATRSQTKHLMNQNRQLPQYNSNFVNVIRDVTCNEVLMTLVNLCDNRVSFC